MDNSRKYTAEDYYALTAEKVELIDGVLYGVSSQPKTTDEKYSAEDYYVLNKGDRVELINGVFYDMSPSPLRIHQEISMELSVLIHSYIKKNNGGCKVYYAPFDVQLSDDTVVVPDISVICDKNKLTKKGCTGAPDWIIEIVSDNAVNDYVRKLNLYQIYGVKEYWIVDPKTKKVMVYIFGDDFSTTIYNFADTIPVNIFNGNLKINISELI